MACMKHRYTDDDDGGNRDRGKQLWEAISPRLIRNRDSIGFFFSPRKITPRNCTSRLRHGNAFSLINLIYIALTRRDPWITPHRAVNR